MHAERVSCYLPFTISPFLDENDEEDCFDNKDDEEEFEDENGRPFVREFHNELRVKPPDEVPWIDFVCPSDFSEQIHPKNSLTDSGDRYDCCFDQLDVSIRSLKLVGDVS